jgi:CO/xanthine dehydrogenase FAD-binding subunit
LKPARFQYFAPDTVGEVFSLLDRFGDDAKILAGGQSLVPMMNFRLVRPGSLIDINRLPNLSYIEQIDATLRIGALTRHRALERSPLIREKHGLVLEAVRLIGHPAIRARGTAGGSFAHADPTAELPAVLAAMDGSVQAVSSRGQRTIPWQDFFVSYFTTSLEPAEMCTEISLPMPPPGAGWAFEEFTRRHGDFAIAGAAAVLAAGDQGRCTLARLALAGAGPTPIRANGVEEFLHGETLSDRVLEEAGRRVAKEVDPDSDLHASREYRRHLLGVMATRALKRAFAGGSATGGKS